MQLARWSAGAGARLTDGRTIGWPKRANETENHLIGSRAVVRVRHTIVTHDIHFVGSRARSHPKRVRACARLRIWQAA